MAIWAIGWAWSRAKLGLRETLWHFNKVSQPLRLGYEDSSLFFSYSWRGEKWHKHQVIPDWKLGESRQKIEDSERHVIYSISPEEGAMRVISSYWFTSTLAWVLGGGWMSAGLFLRQPTLVFTELLWCPEQCIKDVIVQMSNKQLSIICQIRTTLITTHSTARHSTVG